MITLDLLLDNPNHIIKEHITDVVAYARKSRPTSQLTTEEAIEKDLQDQIKRVEQFCNSNGWTYTIKIEIESGENLKDRPVINEVLNEMSKGKYDAIVTTNYDRISRGSASDHERVIYALRSNLALIIEDNGVIYNPYNDQDLQILQMKGNFANYEYRSINGRFISYKRAGAKNGRWVSGSTPYGYDFDRKNRRLMINKEQGDIYRNEILNPFLDGKSTAQIAKSLNQKKITAPRSSEWNKNTVIRLLKSQIHCGDIIYNRTQGSKKKNSEDSINKVPYRKMPVDKWIVSKDAHPKLKTREEHDLVMKIFEKKRPKHVANKNYHPLSGAIKCFHCKKSLSIQKPYKDRESHVKKCECGQTRGGGLSVAIYAVISSVKIMKSTLSKMENIKSNSINKEAYLDEIKSLKNQISLEKQAIERIEEAHENGAYSLESMIKKREKRLNSIFDLETNIRKLNEKLNNNTELSIESKLKKLDDIIHDMENKTEDEIINKAYRTLIDTVIWKRDKDKEIEITVNFALNK